MKGERGDPYVEADLPVVLAAPGVFWFRLGKVVQSFEIGPVQSVKVTAMAVLEDPDMGDRLSFTIEQPL